MDLDPSGHHVLVIDDILDTGHTLEWTLEHLKAKGCASVQSAVMLHKKERQTPSLTNNFDEQVPATWHHASGTYDTPST